MSASIRSYLFLATTAAAALLSSGARAAPGVPADGKVSFGAFYTETNGQSQPAGLSDDGFLVAYYSRATNIVAEDTNSRFDLYVYDRFWGLTALISDAPDGSAGNGEVWLLGASGRKVSSDGRYIMFVSDSTNLVSGDTNGAPDAFVRDMNWFGTTERVSLGTGGTQINALSSAIGMTADGRKCLFTTTAALAPGDTNGGYDLYLYDRVSKVTTLISKRPNGTAFGASNGTISANGAYVVAETSASLVPADTNEKYDVYRLTVANSTPYLVSSNAAGVPSSGGVSWQGSHISSDGSRVAFTTDTADFVSGDTNGTTDVYVKVIATGQILRASTSASGAQSSRRCWNADLTGTGRYISLTCDGDDMVSGDTNGMPDVFVKDLQTGALTRVSRVQNGAQGNSGSGGGIMTPDGSQLVIMSGASNFYSPDTNGFADIFAATRQ